MKTADILRRYPSWIVQLAALEVNRKILRYQILEESPSGSDTGVRSSQTSNPTESKALTLLTKTLEMDARIMLLTSRVETVETALQLLDPMEAAVVDRYYFQESGYRGTMESLDLTSNQVRRILDLVSYKLEYLENLIK